MNPVIENIVTRRSIRTFKEQQIKRDELMEILTAGSFAPTGKGMQSWKFTAIQDPNILQKVNDVMRQALLEIPEEDELYSYFVSHIHKAKDASANFLFHAPTYILVSNQIDNDNSMADSALALGNMMLTAHSLGIGSCWLNQLPRLSGYPKIRELLTELEIPNDHIVFGSIAIGYSAEKIKKAAPRKDVIHII